MNKHYWNEYTSQLIDKNVEKNILKMYQYSLPKLQPKLEEYREILNISNLKKPDIVDKRIDIKEISSLEIKQMYENLKEYLFINKHILCFPVIYIKTTISDQLTNGTYMFDIEKDHLLQLNTKKVMINETKDNIIIFWLLDIESSLVVYGKSSLFSGIKHTLSVRDFVSKGIKLKNVPFYMKHQRYIKDIGLNSRIALFIEADSIEGGI